MMKDRKIQITREMEVVQLARLLEEQNMRIEANFKDLNYTKR